jgi:hypothetical protein
MATIRDVSQAAGASTATVSHLLNGSQYVSPDTKARVEDAIRALNYRPHGVARSRRTGTIGVMVSDIAACCSIESPSAGPTPRRGGCCRLDCMCANHAEPAIATETRSCARRRIRSDWCGFLARSNASAGSMSTGSNWRLG